MGLKPDSLRTTPQYDVKASIWRILYGCFAFTCLFFVLWYVLYTASRSEMWDFGVFYGSAEAAVRGQDFYHLYGRFNLPYWYFPWIAWFFIPLSLLPFEAAKAVYVGLTILSALWLVFRMGPRLGVQLPFSTKVFISAMFLLACWLLFDAGQVDFILAALVMVMVLLLVDRRNLLAGALFPILLFKPHLLLIFIPFAVLRGGRRFVLSAAASVLILAAASLILMPAWPQEMVGMVRQYGQRVDNAWGFTTLPELIGSQENWSGTGNLPVTLSLAALAAAIAWTKRRLPAMPFLAFTLAASLFCAPRAYSYNLPFLLPALLWISPPKVALATLLWLGVGGLALAMQFSTGVYLIVLLAFVLAVLKAHRQLKSAEQVAMS